MHIFVLIICGQILLPCVGWWTPPPGRSFSGTSGAPWHRFKLVENKGKGEETRNWSLVLHRYLLPCPFCHGSSMGSSSTSSFWDEKCGSTGSTRGREQDPLHYEMQRSRANRHQQRTTGPDRGQMMFNVRRKRGVIHQLTRQIPDRMLSNAPRANYWLPMTNWVCILHIFPQTMEVITDYSTALPREGGKSMSEASPED